MVEKPVGYYTVDVQNTSICLVLFKVILLFSQWNIHHDWGIYSDVFYFWGTPLAKVWLHVEFAAQEQLG